MILPVLLSASMLVATPPADCHVGAYRLADGRSVDIGPEAKGHLRWRLVDGRSGELVPDGAGWASRYGWTGRADGHTIGLSPCADGRIRFDGQEGRRIALEVRDSVFEGRGGTRLAGRLVLPPGEAKVPVVVLVHGAEHGSARVDDDMQRQFPAEGVAAFVYDKRGTGDSEGTYTQDYSTLADDAVAAVREARRLAGSRAGRVGFRGGSQGGWVAPLAATRTHVDFVVVGYGLAVSPMEEDREAIGYQLGVRGYGPDVLAHALALSDAASTLLACQFRCSFAPFEALRRRYAGEPWFRAVRGNYTGVLLAIPPERLRTEALKFAFHTPVHYDAMPVLRASATPQLWILGGEDEDAPSAETARRLASLRAAGKPFTTAIFPHAGHGILEFEWSDADGARTWTGYSEGYLRMTLDFARDGALHGRYGEAFVTGRAAGSAGPPKAGL
jgi:dienelactone hydrolase